MASVGYKLSYSTLQYQFMCIYSFIILQLTSRGTVYGIGQSLGSLGRSTGPLIGTLLFAWSERNGM